MTAWRNRPCDLDLCVAVVEQGGYYPADSKDQNELTMAGKFTPILWRKTFCIPMERGLPSLRVGLPVLIF